MYFPGVLYFFLSLLYKGNQYEWSSYTIWEVFYSQGHEDVVSNGEIMLMEGEKVLDCQNKKAHKSLELKVRKRVVLIIIYQQKNDRLRKYPCDRFLGSVAQTKYLF